MRARASLGRAGSGPLPAGSAGWRPQLQEEPAGDHVRAFAREVEAVRSQLDAVDDADAVPAVRADQGVQVDDADPAHGASRSLDPNFLAYDANDDDTNFCQATSFISGGAGDRGTPGAANDPCP